MIAFMAGLLMGLCLGIIVGIWIFSIVGKENTDLDHRGFYRPKL